MEVPPLLPTTTRDCSERMDRGEDAPLGLLGLLRPGEASPPAKGLRRWMLLSLRADRWGLVAGLVPLAARPMCGPSSFCMVSLSDPFAGM